MGKRGGVPRLGESSVTNHTHTVQRVQRVIAVRDLIHAEPGCHSRHRLALRFGMSERQLDKDLDLLRRPGIPRNTLSGPARATTTSQVAW